MEPGKQAIMTAKEEPSKTLPAQSGPHRSTSAQTSSPTMTLKMAKYQRAIEQRTGTTEDQRTGQWYRSGTSQSRTTE